MKTKVTKKNFIENFQNLMDIHSFNMNNKTDTLVENTVFNYGKHFEDFFKFMNDKCSTDKTLYTTSSFLRTKIDEYGENFKNDYINSINKSSKKLFEKFTEDDKIENANNLKKKFCGNLFEIINGFYIIDFQIISGFEFDTWCNNTEDDFLGVDGILKMSANPKIKIPINTKHSYYDEIGKFDPFIKLGNWVKNYTRSLKNSQDKLSMLDLPHDGIIFTDNSSTEFVNKKFTSILIFDEMKLYENLGKKGKNIGNVTIWKEWYKIIKKCK